MNAQSPASPSAAPRSSRAGQPLLIAGLAVTWLAAAVGGMWALNRYDFTPGATVASSASWPAASPLPLAHDRPTLMLFAHARCACTRATLAELAVLMARHGALVDAHVLIYRPVAGGEEWADSALRAQASAIPGVAVSWDEDGAAASLFGVKTSGHALLYDTDGRLLFSGGITASRGHEGDNAGRTALAALLETRVAARPTTPVFGCSIVARKGSPT